MVGASDLAFRLLCRRHGADAAYTEMLFASRIVDKDIGPNYLEERLPLGIAGATKDRPLIVQLCDNGLDPSLIGTAAKTIEARDCADAIDINLGCPIDGAREGDFGAFLLDKHKWHRITDMIIAIRKRTNLPVFCKIRLLEDINDTLELCHAMKEAGCSLIAIHGRTRAQGRWGAADLIAIREVVRNMNGFPILTNGNTTDPKDVSENLSLTGAFGIMSAEGLLRNPSLYGSDARSGPRELGAVTLEYLDLVEIHTPRSFSIVRGHIFWILGGSHKGKHCVFKYLGPYSSVQLRMAIAASKNINDLRKIINATLMAS
eukprot:UC4_evm2s991